jgi:hypothetical protein
MCKSDAARGKRQKLASVPVISVMIWRLCGAEPVDIEIG